MLLVYTNQLVMVSFLIISIKYYDSFSTDYTIQSFLSLNFHRFFCVEKNSSLKKNASESILSILVSFSFPRKKSVCWSTRALFSFSSTMEEGNLICSFIDYETDLFT